MKIILSRKGFDSSWGGCPSPVLPDGTMLSMPIPTNKDNRLRYEDIRFKDSSYLDIWKQLSPRQQEFPSYCHLDPDLRKDVRIVPGNWRAAFGQVDTSQSHLEHQGVGVGDLFLFFGWFRETEYSNNGQLRYKRKAYGKHMLYGYLQVGEIINGDDVAILPWHPHSNLALYRGTNNTIYLAAEKLSGTDLPGWGTFRYDDALVLTKENCSRSRWDLPDFFKEVHISHHSQDSFKDGYFQSVPIGQEFVISEDARISEWALGKIRAGVRQPIHSGMTK